MRNVRSIFPKTTEICARFYVNPMYFWAPFIRNDLQAAIFSIINKAVINSEDFIKELPALPDRTVVAV